MKRIGYFLVAAACVGLVACKSNTGKKINETPTRGSVSILVDETFYPMVEGQVEVFEFQYKYANIHIVTLPEQEIAQWLALDSSRIAVLSRDLTEQEQAFFDSKKIIPRINDVAYDAIALVVNKKQKDTVVSEVELKQMLTGNAKAKKYTLVFDNSKSSTVQYMKNYAGIDDLTKVNAYSVNTNAELIKYVAENDNTIGFIGVDWLYEADSILQPYVKKVKVLAIKTAEGAYKPTQNDIALGAYPLIRKIRIINCQGTAGLGLGFATFMAGDVGQRIILKSGLVPISYPKREILLKSN